MTTLANNKKQPLNGFFVIEFLACLAMVFCTTRQISTIPSAAFTGSFVLLVVWFGKMVLMDGENHFLAIVFAITVTSTACVIASGMLAEEPMTMAYFTDHLVFLSTILFLFVIINTEPTQRTCQVILNINVVIAYVYPIAYRFFPQRDKFDALALNFSNPNLTAMWLLQAVLYASVAMLVLEAPFMRIMAGISIPINVWLILKTEARNCLVSLALFALLCSWMVWKQKPRFSRAMIVFVNLLPIIFVPLYMTYVETIISKGWLDFLIEKGKDLDSRVWIWQNRFRSIENLWPIGNYAQQGANAHNSHMVLLCSYGVIGLLLGTYYLYSVSAEINQKVRSRKNMYALTAFFAVICMGLGEGALFAGGMGIFIPACGFLLLAKCDFGEEKPIALPWQKKSADTGV